MVTHPGFQLLPSYQKWLEQSAPAIKAYKQSFQFTSVEACLQISSFISFCNDTDVIVNCGKS